MAYTLAKKRKKAFIICRQCDCLQNSRESTEELLNRHMVQYEILQTQYVKCKQLE